MMEDNPGVCLVTADCIMLLSTLERLVCSGRVETVGSDTAEVVCEALSVTGDTMLLGELIMLDCCSKDEDRGGPLDVAIVESPSEGRTFRVELWLPVVGDGTDPAKEPTEAVTRMELTALVKELDRLEASDGSSDVWLGSWAEICVLDAADNTEVTSPPTDSDKPEASEAAAEVMLIPASTDVIRLESSGDTELDCGTNEDTKLEDVCGTETVVASPPIDERVESVAPAKGLNRPDGSSSVVLIPSVGIWVVDAADNTEVTSLPRELVKVETSERTAEVILVLASTDVITLDCSDNIELSCGSIEDTTLETVGKISVVILAPPRSVEVDEATESNEVACPSKELVRLDVGKSVGTEPLSIDLDMLDTSDKTELSTPFNEETMLEAVGRKVVVRSALSTAVEITEVVDSKEVSWPTELARLDASFVMAEAPSIGVERLEACDNTELSTPPMEEKMLEAVGRIVVVIPTPLIVVEITDPIDNNEVACSPAELDAPGRFVISEAPSIVLEILETSDDTELSKPLNDERTPEATGRLVTEVEVVGTSTEVTTVSVTEAITLLISDGRLLRI
jgi:hypothetical protein